MSASVSVFKCTGVFFFFFAIFINAVFPPRCSRASQSYTLGEYLGFLGTSVKDFSS